MPALSSKTLVLNELFLKKMVTKLTIHDGQWSDQTVKPDKNICFFETLYTAKPLYTHIVGTN